MTWWLCVVCGIYVFLMFGSEWWVYRDIPGDIPETDLREIYRVDDWRAG